MEKVLSKAPFLASLLPLLRQTHRMGMFYDAMVEAVRARDAIAFLCAAGILSQLRSPEALR